MALDSCPSSLMSVCSFPMAVLLTCPVGGHTVLSVLSQNLSLDFEFLFSHHLSLCYDPSQLYLQNRSRV